MAFIDCMLFVAIGAVIGGAAVGIAVVVAYARAEQEDYYNDDGK